MILLVLGCKPAAQPDPDPLDTSSPIEACSWDVEGIDTSGAIYVDDDAEPDGDGSAGRPFQTLNEGITEGHLILIHPGRYAFVELLVHRAEPVVLMGTCRDEVWIEGADSRPGVYLQAGSTTQLELHDVSVTSEHHGIGAWRGLLLVDDVRVQDVSGFGIYAGSGAVVTVRNTEVDGVEASALGNATALVALDGSTLIATDTQVRNALHSPASAMGAGAELWLERFQASEGPPGGIDVAAGVIAQDGGLVSCVDCELDDLANAGLASIRGSHVVGDRVTIRRTHGESGYTAGLGAAGDSTMVVVESSILDIVGAGVVATDGGHV